MTETRPASTSPSEVRRTTLDSGVQVVTEHLPAVRSAALGFWVPVGSRDETPEQAGCSHFLEHLLFKGTTRRNAREIAEALDAVGGEMNAFTTKELTCFYARVLDRDLGLAVDVLGDMMVDATNTPDDVEAERQVVLEEINIHMDTPEDLVHTDLAEVTLGGHPLGLEVLGSAESIEGMPRDTIDAYYRANYRPETLVVAAAGNVDHDMVVKLIDELVGDLGRPGGTRPAREAPGDAVSNRLKVRHRPTEQAHVAFGGRGLAVDDERRYGQRVLNVILGGGMSSRLFQEIREIRGLAYSTYSYASSYTDSGHWGAYAGTTPAKVDETLKVLREQLDDVVSNVTEDEVERAKGMLKGGMVLGLEDSGSRMSRLGKLAALQVEYKSLDQVLAEVEAVDLDLVRAVAADTYGASRGLAVVGPFDEDEAERFASFLD